MKERFCGYCHKFKPSEGFRKLVHHVSGSSRHMCPGCQAMRKKPLSERIALAEAEKIARKKK